MRKLLLPFALVLALVAGANAQTITKSLQGSQDPRGSVGLDVNNNSYFPNHINALGNLGTNPTFTCVGPCGTSTGTDNAGTVTSSGTTAMTVTFGQAFGAAPSCILQESGGTVVPTFTVATTGILATTVVSATKYYYLCIGNQ